MMVVKFLNDDGDVLYETRCINAFKRMLFNRQTLKWDEYLMVDV